VLRSALVGASDETLFRLKQSEGTLFSSIAAHKEEDERLAWFHDLITNQRLQADRVGPDVLLSQALDESSYESGLPSRARANIAKFLAVLRQRFHTQPCTLGELADLLSQWRGTQSEAEASAEEVTNSVRLLSVHAAKGLEFPIVFVAAMRNGPQNREPIFCFDESHTLGSSWRHPDIGPGISDPVHLRTCARKKRQEAAEEDRLLYVAMTRAEEHLVFTAAPGGKGTWATHVAEGLGLTPGTPKQEMSGDTGRARVVHTCQMPKNDFPLLAAAGAEEVEMLDPPLTPDLHESVVPVTSVAQHAFCPRQYFLARFLGVEPAARAPVEDQAQTDRGEFSASEFGVIIHEMLAGKPHDDAPDDARDLVAQFEESPLGRRIQRATRVGREYDFLIELEGMILRGQIDLWFEEDGELLLVDYKSDQVESGKERWHARRYGPQLRLYAIALERLTGRLPDRALLWYLRTGVAVEVPLSSAALAECKAQVKQLREAQATLSFPLREGEHCVRCAFYQNGCPAQLKQIEDPPNSLL
jgi:ATP-dependent exoDNAse (exonuclease V) beta subunit